ncbi:disease resistance protein At4g27190-like [Durio zibethinus]|uniref:Disease resistance protein At4g27190-like n=1 Tax=Durio zibethinus TaxID=66656 RepID=A0A6P6BHQ4_DURZI|nr:disease resistance protein At4g27190-like [Durio zibethinus]XP_022776642.1 disease resistance protein At4g27190-like [Durio zibethinus]
MADEFAISAASNVAGNLISEYLLKPATRKLRYMFCFNNIVKDLKKKRQELTSAQDRLQYDVEETRKQIQEIQEDVLDWLNAADEVQKDVQSLENEIRETQRCFSWCPNWSYRYKLSKKVAKKTLVVTELVQTSKFERLGRRATLPSIEFFSSKDFMPSKSSNSVLKQIRKALDDDDVNMIGVCGMGGVGKTTLVKIVGIKAKELNLFDQVVFVTVSQNPNLDKIQDGIADTLGLEFDKRSEQGKARQLWLRLIMEKRVLIILDDVWKELNLMAVGIPFGEYHKGCKILVTTRRQQVCSSMRCQTKVQLDVLAEDESWDLFKRNAFLDDTCGTLNDVAREVARECKGLPLAIVTMARALREKSLDEWIVTNQRLKNCRHLDNQEVCEDIYSCLKLSYDYLKGEKLKSCFLSCSLFPEDYEISIEELTRYELGRGLFYEVNLIEDARREIRVLVKSLQNSGLLLDSGKEQFVKMHDVVRDFAHWITSSGDNTFLIKSGIGIEEWPRSENFGCYTTISLMDNKIHNLPNKLECPKLETLLFSGDGSTRVSTTFFEGMSNLKVLTIERVFWLEGLQFLTNLRTLRLEKCKLSNVSSLGELKKLEILDFHGSGIISLPNELGDLPTLRLLDLSDCQRLRRIPSNLLPKLSLLEELYFSGFSVQQWASEGTSLEASNASLSELNSLSRLTALSLNVCSKYFPRGFVFSKLERYGIFINRWYYGSYPTSRTLHIKGCPLEAFKELFSNVEDLTLDGIMGYKNLNVPISYQGRGLNKLTSLELQDCKDIECLIDTTQDQVLGNVAFSNLVKLTIMEMVCLKELCNGQPPKSFLQKLEEMTVRKCKHMISIVPALQNLKEVRVKECDKLQVVFQIDGHMFIKEGRNSMQLLSNLTYLDLEFLPELRSIWKGSIRHVSFQSLKMVRIQDCNKLTFLLSHSLAESLVHLEKLEISHCSRLEQIIINDIALPDQGEPLL